MPSTIDILALLQAIADTPAAINNLSSKLDSLIAEVRPKKRAKVTLHFGNRSITFVTGEKFMATVTDSGGPFVADISNFVDDAGNPATDTDPCVYASSDSTIATVAVADPTKPQEGTVTLTKKLGNVNITATLTPATGPALVVTGNLNVIAGAAVGATMSFSGPGIVPDAPPPVAP